jgi:DNA-directed RNA polymerase subunit M/transcription elongation factor TFIIS
MQAFPPRFCPRCRGIMITERDWYGSYSTCLQCGFVQEMLTSPQIDLLDDEESAGTRQRRRQPSHGKLRL